MKYLFNLYLILLFTLPLSAQQKLQVIDKIYNIPVEHVDILSEDYNLITTSDAEGYATIPSGIDYIRIEHPGFPPQSFDLPIESNVILLDADLIKLKSIQVIANDDKSLELIKKVIALQDKNSPTALENYKFKSYTKLTVDANADSIPYIQKPTNHADSAQNRNKKLLETSMLFISERAIDHFYDKKYGKKNKVAAARIAGLQSPLYELIALQPLSYEFDQDEFNFFFRRFPNPLSKNGMKQFNFSIIDTIHQNGRNLIEVNFNTKKKAKKSIHGYILIDESSSALAKFFAENESKRGSDTYIEVVYEPYKTIWKPVHQVFKLEAKDYGYTVLKDSIISSGDTLHIKKSKKANNWMNATTTFTDFKSPVDLDKNLFKGYESEVKKAAFKDFNQTIPTYRLDSLTNREKEAYTVVDSIGKAEKFDRNLKLLRIITQEGWLNIGKVKLNLLDIVNFNDYEDYRFGINLKTNSSFSQKFGLNVRTFYGVSDKVLKYGLGGWYSVNPNTNAQIFVDYADDITPLGRFINPTSDFRRIYDFKSEQSGNTKYVDQIKQTIGYRQDFFHNLSFEVSLNLAEETSLFEYSFQGGENDREYQNNFVQLALRYAPKEKHIQSPLGKFTYNKGLPHYYVLLDQGVNVFEGNLDYTRVQLTTQQHIRIFDSPTLLNLRLGKVFGEVPIWHYFDGPGKAKSRSQFFQRSRFGGSMIFETMSQGEFISDQYVYGSIKQKLGNIKFSEKYLIPYNVIYKAGYGTLNNKENHSLLNYSEMDNVYQEIGLEFDNVLLRLIGFGFYYRFGAYNQKDFATDFSAKAILNFSFF